jgi:hypothetical protein
LYPTGENKPNPIRSKTDLHRVNFEVNNLKPFPYLAFPHSKGHKTAFKYGGFDGELMASFVPRLRNLPGLNGAGTPITYWNSRLRDQNRREWRTYETETPDPLGEYPRFG